MEREGLRKDVIPPILLIVVFQPPRHRLFYSKIINLLDIEKLTFFILGTFYEVFQIFFKFFFKILKFGTEG